MKIIALVGEPATGKTTIAREVIKRLSPGIPFKQRLVFGSYHIDEEILVLGRYDESLFSGTDRFSMSVQPQAQRFLAQFEEINSRWNIFFEGDRLGNIKFLEFCKKIADLSLFATRVSDEETARRHVERGDSQTETFLKSRRTKVNNIIANFPEFRELINEAPKDLKTSVDLIFAELLKKV